MLCLIRSQKGLVFGNFSLQFDGDGDGSEVRVNGRSTIDTSWGNCRFSVFHHASVDLKYILVVEKARVVLCESCCQFASKMAGVLLEQYIVPAVNIAL